MTPTKFVASISRRIGMSEFNNLINSSHYKTASTTDKMKMLKDLKHYSLESGCDANYEFYKLFDDIEKDLQDAKRLTKETVLHVTAYLKKLSETFPEEDLRSMMGIPKSFESDGVTYRLRRRDDRIKACREINKLNQDLQDAKRLIRELVEMGKYYAENNYLA